MTEKQEEFLRRLNDLFLEYDISFMISHRNQIIFEEDNGQFLKIQEYNRNDGTPQFITQTSFIPGAGTYERTK